MAGRVLRRGRASIRNKYTTWPQAEAARARKQRQFPNFYTRVIQLGPKHFKVEVK